MKKISTDKRQLAETERDLKTTLSTAKEKEKSLNTVTRNAQMLLGYRELELQCRHPSATIQTRTDIPV